MLWFRAWGDMSAVEKMKMNLQRKKIYKRENLTLIFKKFYITFLLPSSLFIFAQFCGYFTIHFPTLRGLCTGAGAYWMSKRSCPIFVYSLYEMDKTSWTHCILPRSCSDTLFNLYLKSKISWEKEKLTRKYSSR